MGTLYMSFTSDESICGREMNTRIMDMVTDNIVMEINKMDREKGEDEKTIKSKKNDWWIKNLKISRLLIENIKLLIYFGECFFK